SLLTTVLDQSEVLLSPRHRQRNFCLKQFWLTPTATLSCRAFRRALVLLCLAAKLEYRMIAAALPPSSVRCPCPELRDAMRRGSRSCFAGPIFLWTGTIRDGAGDGGVCVTGRNIRGRMRLSGNGQAVPRAAHGEGSHDGRYPRYPRWL